MAKAEFFNGTTKLGEDLSSPYTYAWSNLAAGSYNLTAKATDNQGASATSTIVSIIVNIASDCGNLPTYTETKGGYVAGSKAQNVGQRFECKAAILRLVYRHSMGLCTRHRSILGRCMDTIGRA